MVESTDLTSTSSESAARSDATGRGGVLTGGEGFWHPVNRPAVIKSKTWVGIAGNILRPSTTSF
jgi:hypothetical protein